MRRRLRKLRRSREAAVADLGGLVVELHRHGRTQSPLVEQRVKQIAAMDAEMRGLAQALGSELTLGQVVVAGIAGTCANCGALLSTSDRFCSSCGISAVPATDARAAATAPPPTVPATGSKPPPPATAKPLAAAPDGKGAAAKPPPPSAAEPLGSDEPPPARGGQTAGTPATS